MFFSIQRFCILLLTVSLGACSIQLAPPPSSRQQPQPIQPVLVDGFRLASHHWSDVAKIRGEAQRLGMQVAANQITKVQAAQYLNQYRLKLVGSNVVDDNVYEIYLRAAVDSQRGAIDSAQSKALVESALLGWAQRWPVMSPRPNNPAFTNFLMEHMGMPPLR